MAYNGLTNAGAAYLAARQANNLPVEFLKAKVGDGIAPSGTDPAGLTDIISEKMEAEITDIHQIERALKMTVQVSNESLTTGFYLTEIAIFVNDNGTPVLYWYIGKDNGTYVPDSTKPMKYKNILNIEVSSTPITTVNYTGKELWVDEEALKKKFGTREGEILEGHRLAQSLGLEFGGELNNNNLKQAGKAYYDTLNKSIYKCLVDNTTDYADTSKFEAISNDDLLLKLQNLFYYNRQIFNYYNMVIEIERIGKICILSISSHTPSVAQGTITGFPDWCIPKVAGCGAVCGNDPSQATGEIYMDTEGFRWFVSDISRAALYTGQIIYVAKN